MGYADYAASTPQASAAQAQSRDGGEASYHGASDSEQRAWSMLDLRFRVAPSVARSVPKPFARKRGDPLYRPLSVLTTDPMASRLEGKTATINVPYEPLEKGPAGRLFKVDNYDRHKQVAYTKADLDDPGALLKGGYDASPADPRFHQQMVYAVCSSVYASFRSALGRHVAWGFTPRSDGDERLHLRPFGFLGANAYYDQRAGAIVFGYQQMPERKPGARTLPGELVFSCLSHDVIAHEVTHALLDGLRPHFSLPSNPDVPGFHEGFADLVAIFQRLSCKKIVDVTIRKSRGLRDQADMLTTLARQLGHVVGEPALRDALADQSALVYSETLAPHQMGSILVAAVFDAYLTIFRRKTDPYVRLATQGTGILPPGELSGDLVDIMSKSASTLASQFLALIIRAIDYCPPVDIRLGEYLRALLTADHDLVPDDPWAYREALMDAFITRGIYPQHVAVLSEPSLMWRSPDRSLPAIVDLDFGHLRFNGDPACAANERELRRQAVILGEYATRPEHLCEFGLVGDDDPALEAMVAQLPEVSSIRAARRVGPDRQIVFDLVAEIVQCCHVRPTPSTPGFDMYGGATVILGPEGDIRYVISKNASRHNRQERRAQFMRSPVGQEYWQLDSNRYQMPAPLFQMLHGRC